MTTSIADQDADALGGRLSILVRQKRDHERLESLLQLLESTADTQAQDRVLRRIARLVFPHAFAEESVLWPQLRRSVAGGEEWTLRVELEHQEVNELWVELESLPHTDPERPDVLRRLVHVLREDVRDEEDELLPALQATSSVARLRALGVAWEAVRRTAPTRPHPVVSRRPPGNALAGLPLTVLDRTRDRVESAARARPGWEQSARRTSHVLGRLTARLEGNGLLRRGEDAATRHVDR